mmetsp:Transcript_1012/g.1113  ORF Transcript_1012/g.1113 Transcript_1012/m.1113 type:complete len:557 (-) Transcript_1012:189-1859(-)
MSTDFNGIFLFSAVAILSIVKNFAIAKKSVKGDVTNEASKISSVKGLKEVNNKGSNTVYKSTTVSAPGKALIAGGYLVLESPNVGVTISSTSRFYSTVKQLEFKPLDKSSRNELIIQVESPQFGSCFEYQYGVHFDSLISIGESRNEFVEKCLSMVLSYTKEALGYGNFCDILAHVKTTGPLGVKLRADNDFYSQIKELHAQNLPLLSASLIKLEKFCPCPKDKNGLVEVVKTGMGSSAALTTSLVGALLQWFGVIRLGYRHGEEDRRIVHNLAQLAHAVAQGKIGSGFDVSAAVYGTQVYKRFSAESLNICLNNASSSVIFNTVNNNTLWTQQIDPFSLPPSFDLVMGDVCGGSSSTSMAKAVLKWRAEKPVDAEIIWSKLGDVNKDIHKLFQQLTIAHQIDPKGYDDVLSRVAETTSVQWGRQRLSQTPKKDKNGIVTDLSTLKALFHTARELLRDMGIQAGVEIEPAQQTILADKTESLPGVLCAGVPGAGGNDAIFAITLSTAARRRVEAVWSEWGVVEGDVMSGVRVCPLLLKAEGGIKSGVRAEFEMDWD